MVCFQDLFMKSKGQPVMYNGQLIQMMHRIAVPKEVELCLVFESVNADWRQGFCILTEGSIEINGQVAKKGVVLWQNTAPHEVKMTIRSTSGECMVKNVWDVGDGTMHSWHNGAAMIVEETKKGYRYHCNDGLPDDDFDDLVVRIDMSESQS